MKQLSESEYLATMGEPMMCLPPTAAPGYFWDYFDSIPPADFAGHDCSAETVTYVWQHPSGEFLHVLIDSEDRNVFMVLVLDLTKQRVLGHRLLDLNQAYGLTPARQDLITKQKEICARFGAEYEPIEMDLMIALGKNVWSGLLPLNGLRHPKEGQVCGWYLWAGEEFPTEPDFFYVQHVYHLVDSKPEVAKYLGLAAGWRFLVAG
ncbi:MAG TPA: hypothetical protein VN843_17050, partial [Anaerolineales bacterium]|nr:hypothetical protein [Anaerolineales bacterium]